MKNQQQLLDLNEYINHLAPYKRRRGEYHCPVCQGKLSISRGNGAKFTCWAGCDRRDIRRASSNLQAKLMPAAKSGQKESQLNRPNVMKPNAIALPN